MTSHNSNGETDPRQLPDRRVEQFVADSLRAIVSQLDKKVWALDEALSAERKAGVYRVGLHDDAKTDKIAHAAYEAALIGACLVPALDDLADAGIIEPILKDLADRAAAPGAEKTADL